MKSIWTLIKLQFKARIALPKNRGIKTLVKIGLIAAILVALFAGFIALYYLLAIQFVRTNPILDLRHEFLVFTLLGFGILQTLFLIPALIKQLDINNDRELLLKLPITPRQIYVSKVVVSYLFEIVFAVFILLPILIAYGIATSMHWGFYLYIPLILLLIPVIPYFIASMLIYPISKLANFIKSRSIVTSISYFFGLAGAVIAYMLLIEAAMDAIMDATTFRSTLDQNVEGLRNFSSYFVPQRLFANLMDTKWYTALWSFGAILAGSIVLLGISYYVAGANYKKTYQNEGGGYVSIKKKNIYKQRSPFFSVLKKDVKNIFRSPNYTFQFLLLVILTPLVVFFVNRIAITSTYQSFRNTGTIEHGLGMVFGVSVLVMLILLPLVCSFASSSITREGHTIYHTKLIPVSFRKQLLIKSLIIFVPVFVCIVASILLMRIPQEPGAFAPLVYISWVDAMYLMFACTALAIGYICLGIYLDLRRPLCNQVGAGELQKPTHTVNLMMVCGLVVGVVIGTLGLLGNYVELLSLVPNLHVFAKIGSHMRTTLAVVASILGVGSVLLLFLDGPKRYRMIEQS